MVKNVKRLLSLFLVLAVLLSMAAILPASAKGEQEDGTDEVDFNAVYDVVAVDGLVTPKYGKLRNGMAKEGAVMTIALDHSARPDNTFRYWKSIYGDIVDAESFEVYVDRDVYFYPVYSDLSPVFGDWELLEKRGCEQGDIYVRTDPALGYTQYKLKFRNGGSHSEMEFVNVDEDTCRRICRDCGYYEDWEHDLSYNVIKEPTAVEPGLAEYSCNNGCGYSYTEEIDALGELEHEHSWTEYGAEIITEAKDGQPGVRRVHCTQCAATKDVWYIKAEWEKYYFGNHVFFDISDSTGLWGTDDEHHYSFVNDEGHDTYVYAVRKDYRDSDQCWVFLWIDHADSLGRKPLYLAKSRGQGESYIYEPYSWAIVDYGIDTADEYIRAVDHISCGDDSYSSSFFDVVKRFETIYNEQYFPADGPSDFVTNMNGAWEYEFEGTKIDSDTGIAYYDIKYNDSSDFLHIDPLTNCVILRYEPNASYRWSQIKKIQPIVTPDVYEQIITSFPAPEVTEAPEPSEGSEVADHTAHTYGSSYDQVCVNEAYHKNTCTVCGKEVYQAHQFSTVAEPSLDFDDMPRSTGEYHCLYCDYKEKRPYVMSTAEISDDIYRSFSSKSTLGISIRANVTVTPTPVNFQIRVDTSYLVGGPDDNTYESGYASRSRYYSSGYAAMTGYTYAGSRGDFLGFGVIRAAESNYAWVDLKLPEVACYEFKRWELYDWTTGTWQFYSADPTPQINNITYDYDVGGNIIATHNTLVRDLTMLRAVREYVEPETYTVKTIGATFEIDKEWGTYYTEGEVNAGTKIYLNIDESAVPAGMAFDTYEVYDGGELIGTTDGWGYTVDHDGLTFKAVYIERTYWLDVRAEYGHVYLVSAPASAGGKESGKEESGKDEEFWGGEYPAGTQITVTTVSEDEESYPYFLGWYLVTYSEMGEERDLLTADRELTVTVKPSGDKDDYSAYVAVWSDSPEVQEDTEYRTITVSGGFASVRQMHEGLYLSTVRVPYYSSVSFMLDPGAFIDVEKWTLTGSFDVDNDFAADIDDVYYPEYWFEGEDCAPALVYAAPVGVCNLVFADGDGDGEITINDATRIQRVLAAIDDDTYGQTAMSCDLTGNGTVDIVDATLIQRYLAGYEVPNQEKIGELIETIG